MQSDYDNHLLKEAIYCIKANQPEEARRLLQHALDIADDWDTREKANFYMSQVVPDPALKRKYLEETLSINANHADARRALAILDGKLKADDIVDADRLPAQSGETQNAQADRFTCPKCGARMVFDGNGRSLICEHCASSEILSGKTNQSEQDFIVAMATGQGHRAPIAMKTFKCQGCGAQVLLPPEAISETCSYCGSVYVLTGTRELVEPDSIIPMAFDQQRAAKHLVQWAEKHKIKPQGKVQLPRAVYLPIWTFDITGNIPWNGTIYRDKREIPVAGDEMAYYDNLMICAAPKLEKLVAKIESGYSFSDAIGYDARYLAGWPAEIYQKPLAEASLDARRNAVSKVCDAIQDKHGGRVNNLSYSSANLSIVSFALVFIPVWMTQYMFEDHPYRVIVNGQSGLVYGERPTNPIVGWLENVLGGE